MDSKKNSSQVFNNNSQVSRLRGRPKSRWWNCVQKYITKCKLQIGKRDQNQSWLGEVYWRCCSSIEEEEEEEEEVTKYPTFYGLQVSRRVFKKICLRVLR